MVTVFYSSINKIKDEEIVQYLDVLPLFMRKDVLKYRYTRDQKFRLITRLMIKNRMVETNTNEFIEKWTRSSTNKPFIEGWDFFNTAHSGEIACAGFGENNIGIDIEIKGGLNYVEIANYFHPEEKEYVIGAKDCLNTFYEIWVKKEAILKACGKGIVNGINDFSCIGKEVEFDNARWYFHTINIHTEYVCYLCTLNKHEEIIIKEFEPTHLHINK